MHHDKIEESRIRKVLKKPHVVISFLALFILAGLVGYNKTHRNLFPDSNYPQIAVTVVWPGASAAEVAENVSLPIEEKLYALEGIRRVYSTNIDEVSVVNAEFEYGVSIDNALNDASAALSQLGAVLPKDIRQPQIVKITETTAPILVAALFPKKQGGPSLEEIREIAETEIKPKLLKLKGVADVEIFGGYEKELQIVIDKNRLDHYNLTFAQVIKRLSQNANQFAIGAIVSDRSSYLITSKLAKDRIDTISSIRITPNITLSNIATVHFGHDDNRAAFFSGTKPAIAISIRRMATADVITTIDAVEKELTGLLLRFDSIGLEIADTQKDTIEQSTDNMFEALRDAIVMSTIVVFLFLASFRQILVVLVSIPLVYASTVALMWLVGIDFNVVTLTAIILALGLLLDDTVVVMENIERHYKELGKQIKSAVLEGTEEIMFADLSGTVTTMIALAPMLFVGGYPQTVFAPLVGTLLLALAASYIVSIIAVPLLSLYILAIDHPLLLRAEALFDTFSSKLNRMISEFFAFVTDTIVESKRAVIALFALLAALFAVSIKLVLPIVGQELMPPMDTGALHLRITTLPNLSIQKSESLMLEVMQILQEEGKLLRASGTIGSEPGIMSIGSSGGIDRIAIVATYVNRHEREESIWEIAHRIRTRLSKISLLKQADVVPYGATPLSNIRATVNALLSGNNRNDLLEAGEQVRQALMRTQGVVSVSTTWQNDTTYYNFAIDSAEALRYGLTRSDIAAQLQTILKGAKVATFERVGGRDYAIRVTLQAKQRSSVESILQLHIDSAKGKIPLDKVVTPIEYQAPSLITREGLTYTLEVYGDREKAATSHIMASFQKALEQIKLPAGVTIEQAGETKQFQESAKRMVGAIVSAVILIFLALIVLFGNLFIALMILFSIPLTVIGASWTMLLINYHLSMPAMMGFMLLSGIIVNNAILLIHFAIERIKEGMDKKSAMLEAIRIRTRPVLMTAFAVSAGMLPVAQGAAIGLERLAPLGAVAIGGLIVGTLLTLIVIPVLFIISINEARIRQSS